MFDPDFKMRVIQTLRTCVNQRHRRTGKLAEKRHADADWARAHRGVIKQFVTSLEGALQIIKSDEKKARAILAKYTGLPNAVIARIPIPHFDFGIKPEQLEPYQQLMVRQGYPVGKLDMKKLVVTGN
jgi:ABC-type nitrate/sulfonate/bicarbonate transport system substrate-binding protein